MQNTVSCCSEGQEHDYRTQLLPVVAAMFDRVPSGSCNFLHKWTERFFSTNL